MNPKTGERDSLVPDEVADRLDRLYCYHLMMAQWTIAVGSKHSGSHDRLLARLHEDAQPHLAAATQLADRVAELGCTVTADPSDVAYRAPIDAFEWPDSTGDSHRTLVQLHRLVTTGTNAYHALLEEIGESDPASRRIVEGHLAAALYRQRELASAIEGQ